MAFPTISVDEAKKLYDSGYKYVDVRTHEEYNDGHAPGSVCAPVMIKDAAGAMVPNPEFNNIIQQLMPDKSANMIVACRSGARSKTASGIMAGLGYTGLNDMAGGWTAWTAAGYPSEK